MSETERDLSNAQMVGRNGYGVVAVAMPSPAMTRDEALVHAAWLVILAGGELEIGGIIAEICGAPQAVSESDAISAQTLHDSPGGDLDDEAERADVLRMRREMARAAGDDADPRAESRRAGAE